MRLIYAASMETTPDRDSGWIRGFEKLGHEVTVFETRSAREAGVAASLKRRFHLGSENRELQTRLLRLAERAEADWVHFRLPLTIERRTIESLKRTGCVVTQYFNDDPFSDRAPLGLNWRFRRALTAYDGHFVYRRKNVEDYRRAGAAMVEHCPPAYDPARHFPCEEAGGIGASPDAAFIGHWEDDGRATYLERLAEAGFKIVLKGGGWDAAISGGPLAAQKPVTHAFGRDYNLIYSRAVAGLCFFSKLNNDAWTERGLEIVAVGGVLVCERTSEAESHFKNGVEACFFSTPEELIDIVRMLKSKTEKREAIRRAGMKKLLEGGNTIDARAAQVAKFVSTFSRV